MLIDGSGEFNAGAGPHLPSLKSFYRPKMFSGRLLSRKKALIHANQSNKLAKPKKS
jgi:hypothetical protein